LVPATPKPLRRVIASFKASSGESITSVVHDFFSLLGD